MTIAIIIFVIIIIGLLIAKSISNTPERKGKAGEECVSQLARRSMKEGDQLINDVIIPGKNGKTSQIDHIIVSTRGIFVIETKALSGRIYGSQNQEQWTQVLAYGKEKHRIYSPVQQNEVHIGRLRQLIKDYDIPIHNIVVFTQADISRVNCKNVFTQRGFLRFMKSMKEDVIPMEKVEYIATTLRYYKDNPIETNQKHAAKIKETKTNIEEGLCPRCGGILVLRHSKDGKEFYGCSNYPKCRYTKKN